MLTLVASSASFAKTGNRVKAEVMQAGVAGSVKLVNTIFSVKRPVTTPLVEWAKAATERARMERLTRQSGTAPTMTNEEMMISRDRD